MITLKVEERLEVTTDREVVAELRDAALRDAGFGEDGALLPAALDGPPAEPPAARHERFLDVEVIAIYW